MNLTAPRNITRRLALVVLTVGLAACVSRGSIADGSTIGPTQGLLVLKLTGNVESILNFNPYAESTAGSKIAENFLGAKGGLQIIKGERYYVLPVDAGEYMWTKVMIGTSYSELYGKTRFVVRPGVMTYVGHMKIWTTARNISVTVEDNEADMRQHLKVNFPNYSNNFKFEKSLTELSSGL